MPTKSKRAMNRMLNIFEPDGRDWMGYIMTEENPYTFHHIKEQRFGGSWGPDNGAILTREAHEYLNYLEQYCPEAYDEYQAIFRYINSFQGPIPKDIYDDLYQRIYELGLDIYTKNGFTFLRKARDVHEEREKTEFHL